MGRLLIVGLGNPEYNRQANRHNIGYVALSKLALENNEFDIELKNLVKIKSKRNPR